jgi:hypothetical protein
MTLVIAGGIVGAAAALLELVVRRIRRATVSATQTAADAVGIRRHSTQTGVWADTVPAGGDNFLPRHRSGGEVYDPEDTEVIERDPSTGRHSAHNVAREIVDQNWKPVIGRARISVMLTDTSGYAVQIQRVPYALPASPFSGLTVPSNTLPRYQSGKIVPDSYYAFVR